MSRNVRVGGNQWAVPAVGLAGGVAYLVAGLIAGRPGLGVALLAVMVGFSVAVVILRRHSETVRGLMDRRDERIANIDLRATAAAGSVVLLAAVVGFMVELARGHSGAPYSWPAGLGGLAYIVAVVVQRIRS